MLGTVVRALVGGAGIRASMRAGAGGSTMEGPGREPRARRLVNA